MLPVALYVTVTYDGCMTHTTRKGNLAITDPDDPDIQLTVVGLPHSIGLFTVDRDTDQRVIIALGTAQLDALQAEIQRLRQAKGI